LVRAVNRQSCGGGNGNGKLFMDYADSGHVAATAREVGVGHTARPAHVCRS
jgi:hypothetical protein